MGIIRARRKSETRVLLLEAGLRVFSERGVELGSLDDVADAAGFPQSPLYRDFPPQGAVFLAPFGPNPPRGPAGPRPPGGPGGRAAAPPARPPARRGPRVR